jgi:hypothetical protein
MKMKQSLAAATQSTTGLPTKPRKDSAAQILLQLRALTGPDLPDPQ